MRPEPPSNYTVHSIDIESADHFGTLLPDPKPDPQSQVYKILCHVGKLSHIERTGFVLWLQRTMDRM